MQRLELKPTRKPVQNYYSAVCQFDDLGVTHETAIHSAFQGLLDHCARQRDWTLVPEWEIRRLVNDLSLDDFALGPGEHSCAKESTELPSVFEYIKNTGLDAIAHRALKQARRGA